MRHVELFRTADGSSPYEDWLEDQEVKIRAKVFAYVDRVARGAAGNVKRLKGSGGVLEIRIDKGPGYRVYFGEVGKKVILLLAGGTKKTQRKDIQKAAKYWRNYYA